MCNSVLHNADCAKLSDVYIISYTTTSYLGLLIIIRDSRIYKMAQAGPHIYRVQCNVNVLL